MKIHCCLQTLMNNDLCYILNQTRSLLEQTLGKSGGNRSLQQALFAINSSKPTGSGFQSQHNLLFFTFYTKVYTNVQFFQLSKSTALLNILNHTVGNDLGLLGFLFHKMGELMSKKSSFTRVSIFALMQCTEGIS